MQFEGNWSTIQDVIVDKVGKYAYINGSTHDNTTTPIIMDVSLDIRTKVCQSKPRPHFLLIDFVVLVNVSACKAFMFQKQGRLPCDTFQQKQPWLVLPLLAVWDSA